MDDEDAKGMSCRVGIDAQRLLEIVRPVAQQRRTQAKSALMLGVEVLQGWDGQVQMELLRDWAFRPRHLEERCHLLESEPVSSVGVTQDEPVMPSRVGVAMGRRLVSRSVCETEQLPIELRERARIGAIQNRLQQLREPWCGCHLFVWSCVRGTGLKKVSG